MNRCVEKTSDLDVMAERLTPFAVREETREKLKDLAAEYRQRLENLEELLSGGRLSCPICMNADHVICTGNGRENTKKFFCRAYHDPDLTGRSDTNFRFSTYTSWEAYKVYRDFLVDALSVLTCCGGTYEGIARCLNISKHAVEFSLAVLTDYLKDRKPGKIAINEDIVVVYADFSGTRVSRASSIIMSRIGGKVAYQVCCAMNYLTAWNFIRMVKTRLKVKPNTTVVFVTDGECAWVDPVRTFFPDAVHIRQFHSEASRGIVYIHFRYEGKPYTLRTLWDVVLSEGDAGKEALRMRRRRKELEKAKEERTELFPGLVLWEGTVYMPRGTRRKLNRAGATVSGVMEGEAKGAAVSGVMESNNVNVTGEVGISSYIDNLKDQKTFTDRWIAPATDGVKRIFKGSVEEGLKIPSVRYAHSILVRVFGGMYITSNIAESLFTVKPAFRYHRTMKNGNVLVHTLLHLRTELKSKNREELRDFLMSKVVTVERMRRVAVTASRREKDKQIEQTVLDAYHNHQPVVIYYRDSRGKRTTRMVEPHDVETNPYTGGLWVKAYCYLRDADRTFLIDRIVDAIPADTNLSVVSCPSS
jgi:hypothetical protein